VSRTLILISEVAREALQVLVLNLRAGWGALRVAHRILLARGAVARRFAEETEPPALRASLSNPGFEFTEPHSDQLQAHGKTPNVVAPGGAAILGLTITYHLNGLERRSYADDGTFRDEIRTARVVGRRHWSPKLPHHRAQLALA
jgi:hypothetical protein